jgi:hypothetical protein
MTNFQRFKSITTEDTFKGVDKSYSALKESYGITSEGGASSLQWYMVERGDSSWSDSTKNGDLKNLFMSFGIAREDEDEWFKVFNIVDLHNAKRMIIATIPQSECGSYVDGSTVRLRIPTGTGASAYDTFYGASYAGYPDPETGYDVSVDHLVSPTYGGAYTYLFPEFSDIAAGAQPSWGSLPYTGNVDGGAHSNAGLSNWTSANQNGDTFYPHLRATHFNRGDDGRDLPYGVAFLDKGIFVIFDSYQRNNDDYITENTVQYSGGAYEMWSSLTPTFKAMQSDEVTANTDSDERDGIFFSGTNGILNARLTYRTVTEAYKMIYFCHAGPSEFNSSSNHTYNHKLSFFNPDEADSLWITEVGLYDREDDLIAYAKLSEPVEKNKLETLSFKVELEL